MQLSNNYKQSDPPKERILLALLPFWTPSIPPLGISCLKSYLEAFGYPVTTVDANMEPAFRQVYTDYFDIVQQHVPKYKRGNFFNIGMDVMRNHLMAHINYTDADAYRDLVRNIFYNTFYVPVGDEIVVALNSVLDKFYVALEAYITDLVRSVDPDVFGISVFSGSIPASMFAFRIAKKVKPGIRNVMGGGTFSMELHQETPDFERFVSKTPYIDKMMIGEGENLFLYYLQNKLDDSKKIYTLQDIAGTNLDIKSVPLPDFSDFDILSYPQLGAWTSRSCPYQCSFCSETVHWGSYRKKDGKQIMKEMKMLYEKYGVQVFMMGDSLLNIIVEGLSQACSEEETAFYWDGYLRADPPVCDIENTIRWRRAGLYRARLGVESGSQHILDLMNKKISVEQIRQSIKSLAAAGVKTTTYWIVGHPGETEEDFMKTLDLIEELKDDLWEAECNPFSYYLRGQVDSDKWLSEYKRVTVYPESANDMLITQTWMMKDCEPGREEIYRRVSRFVDHCEKLGIPNPYFEHEIYLADQRWKKLQKNAVPALVDFKSNGTYVDECKRVQKLSMLDEVRIDSGDFGF